MRSLLVSVTLLSIAGTAWAHHSYAMFDGTKIATVSGTVARLEWSNPHVFIWIYVRNAQAASGYDLYAFSGGSTNLMSRNGWSPTTLKVGEKLTVDYWPLKDGRTGGHFMKATHEDGRVSRGVSGPNGVLPTQEGDRAR
jgi:hypothetical protein